jgi:hypothetical protein
MGTNTTVFLVGMSAMDISITPVLQEGNPRQVVITAVEKVHRKALWRCHDRRRTPDGQRSSVWSADL